MHEQVNTQPKTEHEKSDLQEQVRTVAKRLGERIRRARRVKHITLDILSDGTGLSPGFLSRLERGETSASIANLITIASHLGIAMKDFFDADNEEPTPNYVLTRANDRDGKAPLTARGYTYHLTTGALINQQMSAFELIYPPGDSHPSEVFTHKGEEILYLLEGTIEFTIGTDTFVLNAGDCVHFSCEQPHTGRNLGPTNARLLMVITPIDSLDSAESPAR